MARWRLKVTQRMILICGFAMYNEIERVVEARIWSTKKEGDGTAGSSQLGGAHYDKGNY